MPQLDHRDNSVANRDDAMTAREREVADLIAQGLSNEQIAERLVVTPGTVANHVAHILAKLGLQSRVQVAVKVAQAKSRGDGEAILRLLESLRQVDSATVREAMQHATNVLAEVFNADKVDAFFYDEAADMLVAAGTSQTALGKLQRDLGLHRLPLASGGRAAWVLREQRTFRDGQVENDPDEHVGVRRDLGVRSTIGAPISVGGGQPGVLLAASRQPEFFSEDQLLLLQFVAYWIGLVARDQAVIERRDIAAERW
jgi:DNA-binding CsgD family transcriptional regulator